MQNPKSSGKSGKKKDLPWSTDRVEETPVVGNLGKEPLRLRQVRGTYNSGTHVVFVVVRVQAVLTQGPPHTPGPGLGRAYSGLDLETPNVQRLSPPATCGRPFCV